MGKKSSNVRLTEEAHGLLAEMAHDCDTDMKAVASEAVIRMATRKHDDSLFAFGAFALGAIAGGVLMCIVFFVKLAI